MSIKQVLSSRKYNSADKGSGIITFFTPTFNRSKLLRRVYNILVHQTDKHFLWLIVNDGSTDDTDEVVNEFINENILPILYLCKENGGKHSAFKIALDYCESEYFQCMDDDDIYSFESVRTYLGEWDNIKAEGKIDEIGAIRTIAIRENGEFVAIPRMDLATKGHREDLTTLEMNYIKRQSQENWTCYRTDALKSVDLFPENYWLSDKHRFFSECIWQGRFARQYKCRYYYVSLREYRDDAAFSLIRANKTKQHYLDMFINHKMQLDEQLDYILRSVRIFIKMLCLVELLRGYLGIGIKDLLKHTDAKLLKISYIVLAPLSLFGKRLITARNEKK